MRIVDVHCHLDLYEMFTKEKIDTDELVKLQTENDVKVIVCNGVHKESNEAVLELAKKHDIVKAALGFYPTHFLDEHKEEFEEELKFIEENKDNIIAIGEIGLDNYHFKDRLEEQKAGFIKLVELAKKLGKPILVHSRSAELETIEILEKLDHKKTVMHCFGGNKKLIKRIIDNGWYFSIPCNIVRAQNFQKIVEQVPFSKILTETDAPYLSPFKDGKPNESRFILESIKKIAEIKQMDPEEVSNQIFMNYQGVFL